MTRTPYPTPKLSPRSTCDILTITGAMCVL